MHKHHLLFIIGSLITAHTCTMDQPPQDNKPIHLVSSLHATTMNAITAGYGTTDVERRKSSAHLITAMQKGYDNGTLQIGTDVIETCKNRYVGLHGWGMDTGNGKEFVYYRGAFIEKVQVARSFDLRTNFLIQQKGEANKYITSNYTNIKIINMQSNMKETTLTGHTDIIHCCTKTRHDDIILSGSSDETIKIWNLKTNKFIQSLSNHQKQVLSIAAENNTFSSTDGTTPLLKIWDLPSSTCQYTYLTGNEPPCSLMMHNALIYVGLNDGTIITIDPRFGVQLASQWKNHKSRASCLIACKSNDSAIYSGSWDQTIKQWDMRNLSACIKKLHKKNNIADATYSIQNIYEDHEGKRIFSSDLNYIYVWNVAQDKPKVLTIASTDNRLMYNCMTMNDDETELYIGTTDGIKTIKPNCNFDELNEILNTK